MTQHTTKRKLQNIRRIDVTMNRTLATTLIILAAYAAVSDDVSAGPPEIRSRSGKYLGDADANRFNPNSVNNQFGKYGSQFEKDSINNQFGRYGSPYSRDSVNNPYESGRYGTRNRDLGEDE